MAPYRKNVQNMGKYSTNQNKNQHTNRKPKFAPENGLQNAQKEGVGKKKTSFPGEKKDERRPEIEAKH